MAKTIYFRTVHLSDVTTFSTPVFFVSQSPGDPPED